MNIGGLQKLTLTDFPRKLAAIVFTQGCNLRCPYCYNETLNPPENSEGENPEFTEQKIIDFLGKRKGKLDALVITGGEPTLQEDLDEFIAKVKDIGYLIKLDTNGTSPGAVKRLIEKDLVDYLAMDFKAPPDKYSQVAGVNVEFAKIKESAGYIADSGKPYEFRTTMVPGLLSKEDVPLMGREIAGAQQWYLQKFMSDDVDLIDNNYKNKKPFTDKEMEEFVKIGSDYVKKCSWR